MGIEPGRAPDESGSQLARSVLVLVVAGALAGIAVNYTYTLARSPRALAWVPVTRELAAFDPADPESLAAADEPATPGSSATTPTAGGAVPTPNASDHASPASPPSVGTTPPQRSAPHENAGTDAPTRAPTPAATPAAPSVPDAGSPRDVGLAMVKQFVDAGAAAIIDARSAEEYAAGHLPGAVNLPFEDTFKDPGLVKRFDPRGRPIIVYCGGGECESSKNLAWALVEGGQRKVLVFGGGVPAWQGAGYPMVRGATP